MTLKFFVFFSPKTVVTAVTINGSSETQLGFCFRLYHPSYFGQDVQKAFAAG
jgi:hypothetical protein